VASCCADENSPVSSHPPDPFRRARCESEVVSALRDCLRDWHPLELGQLPESCRPGKIRDGEDIANLAFALTTTRIASNESNEALVRLETLFAHACQRLSELDKPTSPSPPNDVQERQ
jgi:hypothetical protein